MKKIAALVLLVVSVVFVLSIGTAALASNNSADEKAVSLEAKVLQGGTPEIAAEQDSYEVDVLTQDESTNVQGSCPMQPGDSGNGGCDMTGPGSSAVPNSEIPSGSSGGCH